MLTAISLLLEDDDEENIKDEKEGKLNANGLDPGLKRRNED